MSARSLESARQDLAAFRREIPTLTATARAISGDSSLKIVPTAGTPRTNGKTIFLLPVPGMGEIIPHARNLCGERDVNYLQRCQACARHERTMIILYHELAHILYDTFEAISDADRARILADTLRERPGAGDPAKRAGKIQAAVDDCEKRDGMLSYLRVCQIVSPFMPLLNNALEDARVNAATIRQAPGTKSMFRARSVDGFTNGIENADGSRRFWKDAPRNAQAILGCYAVASGLEPDGWFIPDVETMLADPELRALLAQAQRSQTAGEIYRLCFAVLEKMREHGFCRTSADDQDDPTPEPPTPRPDQTQAPDDDDSDKEPQPGDSDQSDDQSADDQSADDQSDASDDQSADDQSDASDDQSDASDDQSADDQSDASDDQSAPDTGDDSDQDGEPGDGDESDDQGSGSGSDAQGADADDDDEDSDGGPSGVPEDDDDGTGSGNDFDFSDDSDQGADDNGGAESESTDDQDQGAPGAPDTGADDQTDDQDQGADQGAQGAPGGADDEDASSDADDDADDDLDDDDGDTDGEGEPDPDVTDEDIDAVREALKSFTGHDDAPDKVDPYDAADISDSGVPDDDDDSDDEGPTNPDMERALAQEDFDQQSDTLIGLKVLTESVRNAYGTCGFRASGRDNVEMFMPPETVLGKSLLNLRAAFSANRMTSHDRDLKTGTVNARVLGRRVPTGDTRLFQKRRLPGKRDYSVLIGLDISGSTAFHNERLNIIKAAGMAQAELLSRLGIPFAMYAHTGLPDNEVSGVYVAIFTVKDFNQKWDAAARQRCANLVGTGGNLDGHTLEFYRKQMERQSSTDRLIMYYTDGDMPQANFNEELEILQKEIKTCKQSRINLVGVGVGTDSPTAHGLDTIQIDSADDVPLVVQGLRKRLA